MKKVKISKFDIFFSIFLKIDDFAGFSMENLPYLGAELNNFDSKASFGKYIRFY
jgi:hypothetical protein